MERQAIPIAHGGCRTRFQMLLLCSGSVEWLTSLALLEGRRGVGGWLLVVVVVITVLALAYGLFTTWGSGISQHPWGRRSDEDNQPGAQGPDEPSGRDEGEHAPIQHGTR